MHGFGDESQAPAEAEAEAEASTRRLSGFCWVAGAGGGGAAAEGAVAGVYVGVELVVSTKPMQ